MAVLLVRGQGVFYRQVSYAQVLLLGLFRPLRLIRDRTHLHRQKRHRTLFFLLEHDIESRQRNPYLIDLSQGVLVVLVYFYLVLLQEVHELVFLVGVDVDVGDVLHVSLADELSQGLQDGRLSLELLFFLLSLLLLFDESHEEILVVELLQGLVAVEHDLVDVEVLELHLLNGSVELF